MLCPTDQSMRNLLLRNYRPLMTRVYISKNPSLFSQLLCPSKARMALAILSPHLYRISSTFSSFWRHRRIFGPHGTTFASYFFSNQGDRLRHSLTLVPPNNRTDPNLFTNAATGWRYCWALRIRLQISNTARAKGIGVIGSRMTMTRRVSGNTCTG